MDSFDRVVKVFFEAFNFPVENVTPETGPDDVPHWDSLGHMNLVNALEAEFKIEFEIDAIMEMISVAKIVDILKTMEITT